MHSILILFNYALLFIFLSSPRKFPEMASTVFEFLLLLTFILKKQSLIVLFAAAPNAITPSMKVDNEHFVSQFIGFNDGHLSHPRFPYLRELFMLRQQKYISH